MFNHLEGQDENKKTFSQLICGAPLPGRSGFFYAIMNLKDKEKLLIIESLGWKYFGLTYYSCHDDDDKLILTDDAVKEDRRLIEMFEWLEKEFPEQCNWVTQDPIQQAHIAGICYALDFVKILFNEGLEEAKKHYDL